MEKDRMNKKPAPFLAAALTLALGWFGCSPSSNAPAAGTAPVSPTAPADDLAQGFARPPDSARPWVYWMWMDGNLTREGITADLEAMKRPGIGGVIVMRGECRHSPGSRRVHEPGMAEVFQTRCFRGRTAGPGDHPQRRARLDGKRRAVGQARAVHAAHRREPRPNQRAPALRRGPAAAGPPSRVFRRRAAAAGP